MSKTQQNTGTSAAGRPLCRYFASNICFKGDQCEFSHERNARPDMNCRFYLLGSCSYGKACRYDHVRPKNDVISGNTGTEMNKNNASNNKVSIPKTNSKFSANSKPFLPAPTPELNPWRNNASSSLNNFHQNLGLELELIGGPGDVSCSSSAYVHNQMPIAEVPLCPYFEVGLCEVDNCPFIHGSPCDMCGLNILHPNNEEQRKAHHRECLSDHEKEMEAAFASAKSADMQCGICMETIVEKGLRFGILQNCSHCYCLDCIRKWRQQDRQLETKIVRSCPECRVHSHYVIPSKTWIDDKAEKEKLIKIFHENTKKIQCKYVKGSADIDKCPFGNKCFYKHQLPDGTSVEGKSPTTLRKERRHRFDLYDYIIFSDDDSDFEF